VPATDLLDLNVWLALAIEDHAHHQRARHYWYNESNDRIAFCRATSLGFLRLSTNSTVMGGRPLTPQQAWQAYLDFCRLPEVFLSSEPRGCEDLLGRWINDGILTPRLWMDAYLAAYAMTGSQRLVTFDDDFTRFDGLDLLHLNR
jgi:toxin-antitoxin system PIN domain toxin